jgi:competence protein ComEA
VFARRVRSWFVALGVVGCLAVPALGFQDAPKNSDQGRAGNGAAQGTPKSDDGAKAEPPRVDLNRATQQELETLPGIGPSLARAIVAGRPYRKLADLDKVRGIGPARIAAIRDRVTIDGAVPPDAEQAAADSNRSGRSSARASLPPGTKINLNSASQEELEKLPGIGPARAKAIIEHRPYETPEDVMKVPGIKQGIYGRIKDHVTTG